MSCLRAHLVVALAVSFPALVRAQEAAMPSDSATAPARMLVVGSPGEDRWRLSQLLGRARSAGSLIRSASNFQASRDSTAPAFRKLRWNWVAPFAELAWNSELAFSMNDGAAWAGRGFTAAVSGGLQARLGRAQVNFVPQIWTAENRPFAVLPGVDPARSGFSSPWHHGLVSADIPLRFGIAPTTAFDLGESAAWITSSGIALGVASESQWWGPGIRNSLLMSNNAGGFPHAFLRTAAPVRTPAGDIEARWIVGALTESRFFDRVGENDMRSLSGAAVTFSPAIQPNFTAGVARVVYENISGAGALPARAFDVLVRWGGGFNVRWAQGGRAAEQLTTVFGRLVLPKSDAEVYGEWGRILLPTSVRSLLVAPQFTQGFTVGIQWLPAISSESRLRLQLELTNLEQAPMSREADTLSFYASSVVPQGYTHRGQVIGAAIGPGSSSQWLALDYLRGDHSTGAFLGRIRWDTDAYYRQPTSVIYVAYDVSVFGGLRAASRVKGRDVAAELWLQQRYNYLFQNPLYGFSRDGTFDRENVTMRLRVY
jgi:hypothetical protein